jgi:hypothetical protein
MPLDADVLAPRDEAACNGGLIGFRDRVSTLR